VNFLVAKEENAKVEAQEAKDASKVTEMFNASKALKDVAFLQWPKLI